MLSSVGIDMYCEWAGAAVEVERRQQPGQPKTMVAVQVADEDMVEPGKFQALAKHGQLGSFTAIDHK